MTQFHQITPNRFIYQTAETRTETHQNHQLQVRNEIASKGFRIVCITQRSYFLQFLMEKKNPLRTKRQNVRRSRSTRHNAVSLHKVALAAPTLHVSHYSRQSYTLFCHTIFVWRPVFCAGFKFIKQNIIFDRTNKFQYRIFMDAETIAP